MPVAKKNKTKRSNSKKLATVPVIVVKSQSTPHPGFEKKVKAMNKLLSETVFLPD